MENNRNSIKLEVTTKISKQIKEWSTFSHYIDQNKNPKYVQNENFKWAFVQYFQNLENEGYKLFHLTVTYKRTYKRIDVVNTHLPSCNKYFTSFYLKSFVPALLGTTHFNKEKFRPYQPISVAFTEKHKPKTRTIKKASGIEMHEELNFYHHHAFVAIHPETYQIATSITGINKIPVKESNYFVSSVCFEERPISTFQYATKNANLLIDDYLVFSGNHNRLLGAQESVIASNSLSNRSGILLN